jgi:outer membrane protein OmpA-like peptidoglycan-associated protein
MAIRTRGLDRRARTAVVVAVVLILAGPLYLVAKHVTATLSERSEQVFHPQNDELVELRDGSTMLVKHGSSGRRILEWLKLDKEGEETFRVGNGNFEPGSATLTHDGWEHLAQFAQMLKAHTGVSAAVLFSGYHGNRATLKLEHVRADRIRDQVLKLGVDDEQIVVSAEGFEPGHNAAADEGLEVVLTNRG